MTSFSFLSLAAAGIFFLASCSSDKAPATDAASPAGTEAGHNHAPGAEHGGAHSGAHTYSCPMHPEVVSDQPGSCPKCGMTLEHTDGAATNGKAYQMNFASTPAQLAAGKPVTLSFQPQVSGDEQAPVPLAVVHEKKIHLIVVSKDLSEFYHEHPEFKATGRYDVPFTFKTGGDYVLFQDYAPEGGGHQLGRQDVTVAGPQRAAVKFGPEQRQWQQAGYEAALSFDKPVRAGQSLALAVTLRRGGQPVVDLENYLGALGHMVVISEDTRQYLHVHPQDQTDKGPKIGFQTMFEQAGRYRVFLQFNHGGRIHTADFTVNVAPAA